MTAIINSLSRAPDQRLEGDEEKIAKLEKAVEERKRKEEELVETQQRVEFFEFGFAEGMRQVAEEKQNDLDKKRAERDAKREEERARELELAKEGADIENSKEVDKREAA